MLTGGESLHDKGRDGARRAKRWLEATTRVTKAWLVTDPFIGWRCEFKWPHGGRPFTFDIGGILSGSDYEGTSFLAECKNYSGIGDQPAEYIKYLAKCYVAYLDQPKYSDHFMWITWHPFSLRQWSSLCGVDYVKQSVLSEHQRVFGVETQEEAKEHIDEEAVQAVAQRLWLIVLTERQETLVISREHLAEIRAYEVRQGSSS